MPEKQPGSQQMGEVQHRFICLVHRLPMNEVEEAPTIGIIHRGDRMKL